jgi:hypothetical protein
VDQEGSLYIPGKLSGIIPKVSYAPDLEYISKKVASNEAADAVGQQLDKVLEKNPEVRDILNAVLGGVKEESTSVPPETKPFTEGAATSDQVQEPQEGSTKAKKLINNIFNQILK